MNKPPGSQWAPAAPDGCIFCGEKKLTREHVYPDWMSKYVDDQESRTRHVISGRVPDTDGNLVQAYAFKGPMDKSGRHLSRRLKVVCRACNGGWMSELQSKVKPYLAPMLTGKWPDLPSAARWDIARWAFMFSIVNERADPERAAIDQATRARFMGGGIPEPLMVWIGRNRPSLRAHTRTHHRAWGFQNEGFIAQATVASPGALTLVTFSMRWDMQHPMQNAAALEGGDQMGLARIWPPIEVTGPVDWPPPRRLTERDALAIIEGFAKSFKARALPFSACSA